MGLFLEFTGAIALLLLGLRFVREGITKSYGVAIRRIARNTQDRILPSFFTGLLVAVVLQSSTATAMITAGFAGQSLVSVTSAFITMLGADVGTALAVLIASQKIEFLAMMFLSLGVFGTIAIAKKGPSGLFSAIAGLGLVLLGLRLVGSASAGISQVEDFQTILNVIVNYPFWMLVLGIVLSYAAHSSLAVLLITSGLVTNGIVTPVAGLCLVLGANIGSALLPTIANLNASRAAKIPVVANLIIRSAFAGVAFLWVDPLLNVLEAYFPLSMQPAVFHLGLNVLVAMVGILTARLWIGFSKKLLSDETEDDSPLQPKHLDPDIIDDPVKALACAKREALIMADIAQTMVANTLRVFEDNNETLRTTTKDMDDSLDTLFVAVKHYIAKIMHNALDDAETEAALDILNFTANMEHIGDIVDRTLMAHAKKKISRQIEFSDDGRQEIVTLHEAVSANFDLAVNAFLSEKAELARQLYDAKANVRDIERLSIATHIERLGTGVADSIESSGIHLDIVHDLKRINSHLTAIAYPVLKASGEVKKTKWKRRKDA